MEVADSDWLEAACLNLDELLSRDYEAVPELEQSQEISHVRLERWIDVCAAGDEERFDRRLALTGLKRSEVTARLAGVKRLVGVPAPAWLRGVLEVARLLRTDRPAALDKAFAFGQLLSPLVDDYQRRLGELVKADALGESAWRQIRRHLATKLSTLCEMAFYELFLEWRAEILLRIDAGEQSAERLLIDGADLSAFAASFRSIGVDRLLRTRPVLLRLIWEQSEQWLASYATFIRRLCGDRTAIAGVPGWPSLEDQVADLSWGYSDPHNGGASVLLLSFGSGFRIFYKPKELRSDIMVAELLETLRTVGLEESLLVPKVLACDGYGWAEFISQEECSDEVGAATYYRRLGNWLAIFHALCASDMHMENFIAHGDLPVPVDFEMLFQSPRLRPVSTTPETEAEWIASKFLENSVQSTGMLPSYILGQNGDLISTGALEPSVYPVKKMNWSDVNTPRMLLHSEDEVVSITSHLPVRLGRSIGVAEYRADFVTGFSEVYDLISENFDVVSAAILAANFPVRRVIRPTRYYYFLLRRLNDHKRMSDGVLWSVEADFSARFFDWKDSSEQPWKLAASERKQLCTLNIPHFVMKGDDNVISDHAGPVTRLHVAPGLQTAALRVSTLKEDRREQILVTHASLQMPLPETSKPDVTVADGVGSAFGLAAAIRDDLMSRSFGAAKSLAWLGATRLDHETSAQLGLTGYDLYQGSTGIGLFLAALASCGDELAKDQAIAALAGAIAHASHEDLPVLTRSVGIGGAVGVGSIVYGLTAVGEALDYHRAIDAAELFAAQITSEAVHSDRHFDVTAGAAGACLSLLALNRRRPNRRWIDLAAVCGEHLLRGQEPEGGRWVSKSFDRALTGFAHGSAGIGLALSKLYAVTSDDRYRKAIQAAIEFENEHQDSTGNWRDLRQVTPRSSFDAPDQWCYGATGIGMARYAMIGDGAAHADVLRQDVERSCRRVTVAKPKCDSLCCGSAGQIEMLHVVSRHQSELVPAGVMVTKTSDLISSWNRTREFRWNGGTRHFNPGLFQGLSGIGFAALRHAGSKVASPLLLE